MHREALLLSFDTLNLGAHTGAAHEALDQIDHVCSQLTLSPATYLLNWDGGLTMRKRASRRPWVSEEGR